MSQFEIFFIDPRVPTAYERVTQIEDEATMDGSERTMVLTYKYKVLPNSGQHASLARLLEDQRQLYNAALQERLDCHEKTGKGRTYFDQCRALTEWRQSDEEASSVSASLQRWTLKRLDEAYKGFFRRLRDRSSRSGPPRFRGVGRWRSFGFSEFSGIRFKNNRLRFNGIPGGLRVHLHRPLPEGRPLSCSFTRNLDGWYVCFQVRARCDEVKDEFVRPVGIDLGLDNLLALSTGERIPNPRKARRAENEMRRRQRALSRCRRGSTGRKKAKAKVARLHRAVTNARRTFLHQVSTRISKEFGLISVEKLRVGGLARSHLARSFHDASWGLLREFLRYKVERTGGAWIEVDPRYTSQECPGCGAVKVKELSERTHSCSCGCTLDRDVAAAKVILSRAVVGPGDRNVGGHTKRGPGNLAFKEVSK